MSENDKSQDNVLVEMLQSGVHFGHKTSKRHPKMDPYIFGARQGISIINLEQTKAKLDIALQVLEELAANNKKILFLGTKRQAQVSVKTTAQNTEMPYMVTRWIGGLLTNFTSVSGLMRKLTTLKYDREQVYWEQRYTKKERLVLEREIEKLDELVGGIEKLETLPDAMFIVDCKKEKTAVDEAVKMKIPVIAIVDTNVNPAAIKYPIPANDDGTKSITYLLAKVNNAVMRGKKRAVVVEPVAPATPVAAAPVSQTPALAPTPAA